MWGRRGGVTAERLGVGEGWREVVRVRSGEVEGGGGVRAIEWWKSRREWGKDVDRGNGLGIRQR